MLTGSRTSRGLGAVLAGVTLAGAAAVTLASPAFAATGGVLIYGLTDNNQLVSFRADTPGTPIGNPRTIAGLGSTEDVVGIDVRPATGVLYGVVNNSGASGDRLITINPDTGAVLSTISLDTQLVGNAFGVDFNPQADALRIVSDGTTGSGAMNGTNASYNTNVTTGVVTRQGDLNPGEPAVRAAAYVNNQSNVNGGPGVTSGAAATNTTMLLDIDVQGQDRLAQQAVATGALTYRGVTGQDVDESATNTASVGFDIEAVTNVGYAVFETTNGNDRLYRVNLTTGAATDAGAFAFANDVEDIAVASPRLVVSDAQANEGQSANVTVTRTGDTADTATAVLTPVTGGANGNATSGTDFDPATKTVTFAAGATTASAAFPLVTDSTAESSETFTVTISSIQSNGNNVAAGRSGVVTILDGAARNTNGRFHPLTPARVFDSRANNGSRIQAGQDRNIQITGVAGVPATATAIVVNVTNTLASARGDLQVYPTGQRPANRTSNLNFFAGETVPVQVQTGLGTNGQITVSVNTGSTHVIVDVFGYYGDASDTIAGTSGYTALTPSRLLDTRTSRTPVVAGSDQQFVVGGKGGVPATATAVILNTTVLGTPANADLQVYPTGRKPANRTSNLNVRRGQTKANSVTVALGSNGSIGLSVSQNSAQVVLDVLGYYSVESRGRFIPLTPSRIFDTRSNGTTASNPLRAGADRNVNVGGQGGVPAGAAAAVLSVTGTGASNPVDLQVFPTGNRPANRTSTVNFRPGEAVANLAVATLGTNGQVTLSLSQGSAAVILDAVGYIVND